MNFNFSKLDCWKRLEFIGRLNKPTEVETTRACFIGEEYYFRKIVSRS
jgi:hypothetical protein